MWYDANGNYLTASVFNDYPTDTSNFTTYQHQFTKPANAAFYTVSCGITPGAGPQMGDIQLSPQALPTSPPPVVGTKVFAYDQDGQLRWDIDATGLKTYHIYDKAGRKTADVAAGGDIIEYKYDADNRIVATIHYCTRLTSTQILSLDNQNAPADINTLRPARDDQHDLWTWTVYDKEGRVLQSIDGAGDTAVNSYDAEGKLVATTHYYNKIDSTTVANFKTTLPTTVTLPTANSSKDAVTQIFYDKDGRLLGRLDANGFLTQNIYDKAGQKTDAIAFANAATVTTGTFNQILASVTADSTRDQHIRYVYNGQGQLRFAIDSSLHVIETQFDNTGQATTVIRYANALASTTTNFAYSNVEALVAATGFASSLDRKSWSIYDSAGRVAYSVAATGAVTNFVYNASGQVTKETQFATVYAMGALPTKAQMDSWATTNASSLNDRTTRYYYDGAGVLRYIIDGEGYVTRRTEDAEARLPKTERLANAITVTESDTINTVDANVTANAGAAVVNTNIYDYMGRLNTTVDAQGIRTDYDYIGNGALTQVTHAAATADQSVTSYYLDGAGRVLIETKAVGTSYQAQTTYTYDGLGNVLTITDPDGNVTAQTFDKDGNLLTRTEASGTSLAATTSYAYNAFGEVVQTTDPNGNVSYNYYNNLGQLTTSCDALKYVTATSYTAFGEVQSVTRYYNAATNSPSVTTPPTITTNAKDATTSFTYDKLGRLTQTTDAEGYSETYTLDAFGNRHIVVNKLGGTITNVFDRRGLLKSETLPMASVNSSGTTVASTVTNTFTYDSRGNRTKMVEASGLAEQRTTNYEYDSDNRLTRKYGDAVTTVGYNDFTTTTAVTATTTTGVIGNNWFSYDARGNLTRSIDANGAPTYYYYNALNQKIAEVGPLGTLKTWTYDKVGNVLTQQVYGDLLTTLPTTPGGSPPSPVNANNYRLTTYTYDALNRLSTTSIAGVLVGSWNSASSGVTTTTQTVTSSLTYDSDGNVVKSVDANGNVVYSWYDKLGRKTDQLDGEGYLTHWDYYSDGNVSTEKRYATQWTGTVSTSAPPAVVSDATNDRVTNFTYDRNGRRLTETRTGVTAWTVSSSNGALTAASASSTITYTYNGLGEVTSKQEATGDTVSYGYDNAGRLTKETRASFTDQTGTSVTPEVLYSYDGLNDLTRTQQGNKTTIEGSTTAGLITTYSYSAGGRLASVTDPAGGTHNYDYDAAGNLVRDWYVRSKSDGTTVTEGILYRRDLLGRVVAQAVATKNSATSWTRGDCQNTFYDAYGEVSQRGINGSYQETFSYNNRGLVEKTNTGDGVWRFYYYDADGNQTLTIESEGTDLSTDTSAQALSLAKNGGSAAGASFVSGINCTITVYNKRNQAIQVRQPQRETTAVGSALVSINTSQAYNAFGEVASQTDANGNTTSFGYNTTGRLIKKTMPQVSYTDATGLVHSNVSPIENYYYDLSGRLVATKDANGNTNSRTLLAGSGYGGTDSLVLKEFHPDGGVKSTAYDVYGNARTLTDEVGDVETRTYDGMGRLLTQTHAASQSGSLVDNYTYDLLGQRITHWNNQFGSTVKETTDYDLQGRIVSNVNFAGDVTSTTYSWNGSLVTTGFGTVGGWHKVTTYASGKTLIEDQDLYGHEAAETDLGGHSITFTYDKAGRQLTQAAAGQTITTTWFNTGLIQKNSLGASDYSTYTYDANGNKKTEATVRGGVSYQNSTATYDALNRLVTVSDSGDSSAPMSASYEYDLNGNIRHVGASYHALSGTTGTYASSSTPQDFWYLYDSMNRETVAMGTLSGSRGSGTIVRGYTGTDIQWNAASQRMNETETLTIAVPMYDNMGHLIGTNYYDVDLRHYYTYYNDGNLHTDAIYTPGPNNGPAPQTQPANATVLGYNRDLMGRVTSETNQGTTTSSTTYDNRNNVISQTANGVTTTFDYKLATSPGVYNGAYVGMVTHSHSSGGSNTTDTVNTYNWWNGAEIASTAVTVGTSTTNTSYTYDAAGRLTSANIGGTGTATYINDLDGRELKRSGGTVAERNYEFDGKTIGRLSTAGAWSTFSNQSTLYGNFDTKYAPVSQTAQGAGSTYTVQKDGETLEIIAQRLWGDSSLWYILAEANGLTGNEVFNAGQVLMVPGGVISQHNTSSTFQPYDPNQPYLHTDPSFPPPPAAAVTPKPHHSNGCGVVGQLFVAAIAIAVAVALPEVFPALGPSMLGGGVLGGAVSGAIGGAVGSVVSQGVGLATGIQNSFSWKGVALAALGGAVGGGLAGGKVFQAAGIGGKIAGSPFVGAVVRGAAQSVLTQGVEVATGLQSKFDWAGVAAAGIGAGVGSALGVRGISHNNRSISAYLSNAGAGMASDIANAATRSLINGSDFGDNLLAALPDTIGQTVGNMVATGVAERSTAFAPAAAQLSAHDISEHMKALGGSLQSTFLGGSALAAPGQTGENEAVTLGQGGGQVGQQAASSQANGSQEIVVTGQRYPKWSPVAFDPTVFEQSISTGRTHTETVAAPPEMQKLFQEHLQLYPHASGAELKDYVQFLDSAFGINASSVGTLADWNAYAAAPNKGTTLYIQKEVANSLWQQILGEFDTSPVGTATLQALNVGSFGLLPLVDSNAATVLNLTAQQNPTAAKVGIAVGIGGSLLTGGISAGTSEAVEGTTLDAIDPAFLEELRGGGSFLLRDDQFAAYIENAPASQLIGREDGQFITSAAHMNHAIDTTGGDPVLLGELLGIPSWSADTSLVRIDVLDPLNYNPRLPSSTLSGANPLYVPGGLTSGGVPEVVIDQVPASQIWATPVPTTP